MKMVPDTCIVLGVDWIAGRQLLEGGGHFHIQTPVDIHRILIASGARG